MAGKIIQNNVFTLGVTDYIAKKISKKYNLEYFFVTEGASSTKVENCGAVRNARNNHIEWEKENGYNPNEDWSEKITTLW